MSYPSSRPGKYLFSGIVVALLAIGVKAAASPENFGDCARQFPHISSNFTLYLRDTSLEVKRSGIIRRQRNGDVIIAVPRSSTGHYKVRFFDGANAFLFEVRQIRESPLIVEKYNFVHAGVFQYELYHDNSLIEKDRFTIGPN